MSNMFVPIALFGWIPAVLMLFALLPPRRAVVVAFVAAWLFLPMAAYGLPGLPDYTKMTATSFGIMLGVIIFDSGRFSRLRAHWIDLPMAVWCICPFAASVTNGLGVYDGASSMMYQTVQWGLPYLIGRMYFSDLDGLRDLAIGIFVGGLVYVPFCLYEIRMSPQLHELVYGFHQHSFNQTRRLGGWRPMVFLQHGLMVGMWMTSATLVGAWLWRAGALRRLWSIPISVLVGIQAVTTVLCKSTGAVVLLVMGAGLLATHRFRLGAIVLVLLPPIYLSARMQGWYPSVAVDAAAVINEWRAGSLGMRFDNEALLVEKALERPFFGWGAHNRNRVIDDDGRMISVTDSLWIIAVGQKGLVGLISLTAALLLAPGLILIGALPRAWTLPQVAPAIVLSVVVILFAWDCLINGMINPIYVLAAGGLSGTCTVLMPRRWVAPTPSAAAPSCEVGVT